jgi:uncharacterized delta-60 repeat protein
VSVVPKSKTVPCQERLAAIAVDPASDDIVVVGSRVDHIFDGGSYVGSTPSDMILVRMNAQGAIDSSFGTKGQVITALGPEDDLPYAALVVPGGDIRVCGAYEVVRDGGAGQAGFVAAYRKSGAIDASFGPSGNGLVRSTLSLNDDLRAMSRRADGRLVVTGSTISAATRDILMLGLTPGGLADLGFAGGGVLVQSMAGNQFAYDTFLANDADLYVAGITDGASLLFRFSAAGGFKAQFSYPQAPVVVDVRALDVRPTGEVVFAGDNNAGNFGVQQMRADGTLDEAFGSGGVASTDLGGADGIGRVRIDSAGHILAGGTSVGTV